MTERFALKSFFAEIFDFKRNQTHKSSNENPSELGDQNDDEPPDLLYGEKSKAMSIPARRIPEGPVQFGSIGDGDKLIRRLLEVETKEQLYEIR